MSEKSDTRYILQHIKSGFYVTGADTYTAVISKAKLYETNPKQTPAEWADLLSTGEYEVVKRTETITVEYEGVKFE